MNMVTATLALALSALATVPAHAEPPQITWEWFNTAELYRLSGARRPADLKLAAHYFRLAARDGNAAAAYKLGEAYENGKGVRQDFAEALHWYRKSADGGDKHAELRIGWFHHKGLAVPADPVLAASWYKRSADKDNIWAYHMLAFMLMDGEGVPKNPELARQYFETSVPQTNDHWAKLKLALLIRVSDPTRSKALLRQAAAAGNVQAIDELKWP